MSERNRSSYEQSNILMRLKRAGAVGASALALMGVVEVGGRAIDNIKGPEPVEAQFDEDSVEGVDYKEYVLEPGGTAWGTAVSHLGRIGREDLDVRPFSDEAQNQLMNDGTPGVAAPGDVVKLRIPSEK